MLQSIELFGIIGFVLAAYSIVANDAIQTLGTFLSSNRLRPWWVLWIYASSLIVAVMVFGYVTRQGDIAFGRLNAIPFPDAGVQWWHAVPPLALLLLTRLGIPASTTFLVLTVFALTGGEATEGVLEQMIAKSALGYVVALTVGGIVYLCVSRFWVLWIARTKNAPIAPIWLVLQWLSTAFLWSQWLMQDLANIFVFLPRETMYSETRTSVAFDMWALVFATIVMLVLHAWIFSTRGGKIQQIVLSKTNVTDVRAATMIDFVYGCILLIFIELNDIPMSTTWVFLGLIAGREIAIAYSTGLRSHREAILDVGTDILRAWFGLFVSAAIAIAIPWIATGQTPGL